MRPGIQAVFRARAQVMKALAHPTRLFIVDELSRGKRCVCELTGMVGADVSTVSKHLSVLKNAGIVEDERRGVQVFYSLKCPCVIGFISCTEEVLKNEARRHLDLAMAAGRHRDWEPSPAVPGARAKRGMQKGDSR